MKLLMMVHGQEAAHNMEVLSQKYPGIMINAENLIYCPLCRFQNMLEFNKSYDGIVENPKNLEENAKES